MRSRLSLRGVPRDAGRRGNLLLVARNPNEIASPAFQGGRNDTFRPSVSATVTECLPMVDSTHRLSDCAEFAGRNAGSALYAFLLLYAGHSFLLPSNRVGRTLLETKPAHCAFVVNYFEIDEICAKQRWAVLFSYVSVILVPEVTDCAQDWIRRCFAQTARGVGTYVSSEILQELYVSFLSSSMHNVGEGLVHDFEPFTARGAFSARLL